MDKAKTSVRYDQKREQIIQAATVILNERGASGMVMRDVAKAVSFRPAALAYYFKTKDELAIAVFQRRLDSVEHIVSTAARESGPVARVEKLIELELERLANTIEGRAPALSRLPSSNDGLQYDDIRTNLHELFRRIDRFFDEPKNQEERDLLGARSYMLVGLLFFMATWVWQYPVEDFGRIRSRIMGLLQTGLAVPGWDWTPQVFEVDEQELGGSKPEFLRVATRLMNEHGYLGMSVDDIVEQLDLTKGSFYHHLSSKDELVVECIRVNFERISRAIEKSKAAGGSYLQQLSSTIATIISLQFKQDWPLLRSTAFASLPLPLRNEVSTRSNRMALRFSSGLIDGIAEGSVRTIDPLIVGHIINSTLYSALGLQDWASRLPTERAVAVYESTLIYGLFDPDVPQKLKGHQPQSSH